MTLFDFTKAYRMKNLTNFKVFTSAEHNLFMVSFSDGHVSIVHQEVALNFLFKQHLHLNHQVKVD